VYDLLVFLHLLGVFGFLGAHGVSAGVSVRLRKERDVGRLRALLDLSRSSLLVANISFLVLIGGGLAAATYNHLWDQGWVRASILVVLVLLIAPPALAAPYFTKLRRTVGAPPRRGQPAGEPASPEEVDRVLRDRRPVILNIIGLVSLLVVLWLMTVKPF
jgi:hypothetical protein